MLCYSSHVGWLFWTFVNHASMSATPYRARPRGLTTLAGMPDRPDSKFRWSAQGQGERVASFSRVHKARKRPHRLGRIPWLMVVVKPLRSPQQMV